MAQIFLPIKVEVAKPNFFQAIVAKQYDNDSRWLEVTFVNEKDKIFIYPDSAAMINAKRNDGEEMSFKGEVMSDGTVVVPLTSWMLELAGTLECDISVINWEGKKLTSTKFTVEVERASCSDQSITEDENYGVLVDLLTEVRQVKADATAAASEAEAAASVARSASTAAGNAAKAANDAASSATAAANEASEVVNFAMTDVLEATENANEAKNNANTAATKANNAANIANTAAELARQAAENANMTAGLPFYIYADVSYLSNNTVSFDDPIGLIGAITTAYQSGKQVILIANAAFNYDLPKAPLIMPMTYLVPNMFAVFSVMQQRTSYEIAIMGENSTANKYEL